MNELLNLDNMLTAVNVLVGRNEYALRHGFEVTGLLPHSDVIGAEAYHRIHDFIDQHTNANKIYDACAANQRLGGNELFYRITSATIEVGWVLALHNKDGKITATFAIPS